MKKRVNNKIELNDGSVWVLANGNTINYSEGRFFENYLEKVFRKATDLSSKSYELERYIRDWSSEYHLSRKRTQLLRGFEYDRTKKVLEVGCGCGAITRFLAETFDDVVAVEGSESRARLARLRTKDMNNVSVLCAPFHEVDFKEPFDIIFCVGVFEYSNAFVNKDNPYDYILEYFKDILTPDGVVVLAIENQFGLKYFSSSSEDHTDVMFDGIEGYPRFKNRGRTFGYYELRSRLKKYYENVEFYFPYPDYKIPSCVLAERAFNKIKAGELAGLYRPRDYSGRRKPLFDENIALLELDKNNQLPFFSNSFLVIAGRHNISSIKFDQLGLAYSENRISEFQTVTRILECENKRIFVNKVPQCGLEVVTLGKMSLHTCKDEWLNEPTLHAQILKRVREINVSIEDIFAPCKLWLYYLKSLCTKEMGVELLDGKYLDCLWSNCFIFDNKCIFIDAEWEWRDKIDLNVMVIRAIYNFLVALKNIPDVTSALKTHSMRLLIIRIASSLNVLLNKKDFDRFCKLESSIANAVYGISDFRHAVSINILLYCNSYFIIALLGCIPRKCRSLFRRIQNKMFVLREKLCRGRP
ncbi:MAG: class I SAM-dependent methyltransferase [Pseudomonadota bacterium]